MFMLRLCVSTLKEYHRENKKTYVYLSGATALICSEKDEAADSVVILIPDATYFSIKAILFAFPGGYFQQHCISFNLNLLEQFDARCLRGQRRLRVDLVAPPPLEGGQALVVNSLSSAWPLFALPDSRSFFFFDCLPHGCAQHSHVRWRCLSLCCDI
jgi:hypothetical protein